MITTPPRTLSDWDRLARYQESIDALRQRVARESARVRAAGDAAAREPRAPEQVLEQLLTRQFNIAPAAAERTSSPFSLTKVRDGRTPPKQLVSFADEREAIKLAVSPSSAADSSSPVVEMHRPRASHSREVNRFAELLAETEHLSQVVATLRRDQEERDATWSERVKLLKSEIADRDRKIESLRASQEDLLRDLERLRSTTQQSAAVAGEEAAAMIEGLKRSVNDLEKRLKSAGEDAIQREDLLRFQESEIRRLEGLVATTSKAAVEAERRAEAGSVSHIERLSALEDERATLLSQRRDMEIALAAAQASLAALSASIASPNSRKVNPAAEGETIDESNFLSKLHNDLENLRHRCGALLNDRALLTHQCSQLKARCDKLATKVVEAESTQLQLANSTEQAHGELSTVKAAAARHELKRQQLQKALATAQKDLETTATDLSELRRESSEQLRLKQLRIASLEDEIAAVKADRTRAHQDIAADQVAARSALTLRVGQLEEQLAEAMSKASALSTEVAHATREKQELHDSLLKAQSDAHSKASRLLELEQEASELRERTAAAESEVKRELTRLNSALAALQERCTAALQDAQTARKQRDVALERNQMLQKTMEREMEAASANAKLQIKQIATMLSRREEELSASRERIAVLEAVHSASALTIEKQQEMMRTGR